MNFSTNGLKPKDHETTKTNNKNSEGKYSLS